MDDKVVKGENQSDGRWIQVSVGLSLLTFIGVVVSIFMTAFQDFECKPATIENPLHSSPFGDSAVNKQPLGPFEPVIPGVMAGTTRPRLVLATEPYWTPYTFIDPRTGLSEGVVVDVAKGMSKLCDLDITVTQTKWTECWADQAMGPGLVNGDYHACMTYTHSKGARDRQMEFSHGLVRNSKPAGLLVRLNDDGAPEIDGNHNLNGTKIVHVNSWAPTEDGLGFVQNQCTGERFSGYTMIPSSAENPNDDALGKLLDGTADAMWVFVDQSEHYRRAGCVAGDPNKKSSFPDWDCAKWAGFGTKFAFIQTGLFDHAHNGTTFTASKKGSGLNEIINPCMERFMQTKEYYEICAKHGVAVDCYPNTFFPKEYSIKNTPVWEMKTKDLPTSCTDGYCACPM
mmetsp:Transcript_11306/g.21536  ORF Transcript_11306/g.21536 Transcript_11306/m.21536 type:complete len:398 (+) Transcript_11306:220-1413(+)|eukprot:CAMPEP_0114244878 /NCGR_PEP_ID=MMETSP0058-20121206/11581_1 /TAXON_ID=36894 /ORGANISM="Pyramimonas parkeae, CCMP726" /LENGTH=397 /DNA_ID=CAMNT_0001357861 /DNA_START=208 /DNA_END=1401 /DNA_ORIENTATION=-